MFRRAFFASLLAPLTACFLPIVKTKQPKRHILLHGFSTVPGYRDGLPFLRSGKVDTDGTFHAVPATPPDPESTAWPRDRQYTLNAVLQVGTIDELVAAFRKSLEVMEAETDKLTLLDLHWPEEIQKMLAQASINEYRELPLASPELLAAVEAKRQALLATA